MYITCILVTFYAQERLSFRYTDLLKSRATASNQETEERITELIQYHDNEKKMTEEKYERIIKVILITQ